MKYVIGGAYSAIGAALARKLAAKGNELLLLGRNGEKLAALGVELSAQHSAMDLTVLDAVDAAVAGFGPIDGMVNCAGSLLLKPAHITTEAEWQATIDANLTTAFVCLRAAVRNMPTGGAIVLVSSAAGRTGLAHHEAIAAAKAGIMGLTLSAAATYAPRNIRVNCIAPGLVDSPMTARIIANEASLKASTAMHALGRVGKPEDVAAMMDFLLDPTNAWITGQTIGVDGGLGSLRSR